MGFDEDLTRALANAKLETAKLLVEQRKLSPDQAMALVSKVSDCRVTQVVDIKKGVHCITSKDSRKSLAEPRPTAETSEFLVTHASNADMNKAMDAASWSMIELLQKEKSLSHLDAYSLASMTMDCRVGGNGRSRERSTLLSAKKSLDQTLSAGAPRGGFPQQMRRWRDERRALLGVSGCSDLCQSPHLVGLKARSANVNSL